MKDGEALKPVFRVLIGLLCAAALLLIALIISGSGLDDTAARAIASAVGLALAALIATAGISLRERSPLEALFGFTVIAISASAFLIGEIALWTEAGSGAWELPAVLIILALGGGHASILLGRSRAEDADAVRAVRAGVLLAIALLCLMATVEIASDGRAVDPKTFGVVAVLYLLGTLVLPLARRNAGKQPRSASPSAVGVLREHGLEVVDGPVDRAGAHGRGISVSLRQADGTLVELITYDVPGEA